MMHKSLDVFILSDEVTGIMACYEPDEPPVLFKTFDKKIAVDDYIVVETNTRHNMTVVQVTAVGVEPDYSSDTPVKWVIDKVDNSELKDILDAEEEGNKVIAECTKRSERTRLQQSLVEMDDSVKALRLFSRKAKGDVWGIDKK
tara:strand:- start:2312 stop:2743 length:432 start_codon:yes stop_codon:yes gene_type:complete